MDAVSTTSLTGSLNILVAVALIFLAVSLLAVSIPLMSMVKQSERTLSSLDKLLSTVDKELGPTLKQVDTLLGSVVELKSAAQKSITDVGSKVGDVKGGLTKAADDAKHQSSVLGAGFMAGLKAYLEGRPARDEAREKSRAERKSLSEVGK
ncbi:MAG: hypothetical protein KGS72_00650 [Cyanobacteria bacterium REEB67]|nr:hypothetical protein [Cyanobacteria bacterium REEB67]